MKLLRFVQKCHQTFIEKIKWSERALYNRRKRMKLKNTDFTIIASNCIGSIIYHDMGLRFLSPTVNLAISMADFVKMAEHLKRYMEEEIVEIKGENGCPVGLLGDVKINFVHYDTFEEGAKKWEERKRRINWDNIFIVGTEKDGCCYETLQRFDRLPYKNKVVFTHKEYPEFSSAYYIKGFEEKEELGVLTFYKKQFFRRRFIDDFDYVEFLNRSSEKKAGGNKHG